MPRTDKSGSNTADDVTKVLKAARAPIVDTPMSASEMMSAIRKTHAQPQTTLERDATRYRWLREHQNCLPDLSHCSRDLQARTLDAFTDAELEKSNVQNDKSRSQMTNSPLAPMATEADLLRLARIVANGGYLYSASEFVDELEKRIADRRRVAEMEAKLNPPQPPECAP